MAGRRDRQPRNSAREPDIVRLREQGVTLAEIGRRPRHQRPVDLGRIHRGRGLPRRAQRPAPQGTLQLAFEAPGGGPGPLAVRPL